MQLRNQHALNPPDGQPNLYVTGPRSYTRGRFKRNRTGGPGIGSPTDPYEILAIKCAFDRLSKKVGKPLLAQLFYRFFRRFPRLALEHRKDVLPNETEGGNSVVIGEPDPRRE